VEFDNRKPLEAFSSLNHWQTQQSPVSVSTSTFTILQKKKMEDKINRNYHSRSIKRFSFYYTPKNGLKHILNCLNVQECKYIEGQIIQSQLSGPACQEY